MSFTHANWPISHAETSLQCVTHEICMQIAILDVEALARNAQSRVPHVERRSAGTSSASVATLPRPTYTASDRPLVRRPTK